jgi:hypothetical protein
MKTALHYLACLFMCVSLLPRNVVRVSSIVDQLHANVLDVQSNASSTSISSTGSTTIAESSSNGILSIIRGRTFVRSSSPRSDLRDIAKRVSYSA